MNDLLRMERGSPVRPASSPDSIGRIRSRTTRQQVVPCANRAWATPSDAQSDRVTVLHAYAEMRFLLRNTALAAGEAAGQARLLAALLDDVLSGVTGAELAADDADFAGVAFRREMPGLTPRERDVLALVAEGRSNKAIAEALFVSPNTVKTHVASLLTKLQADSRTQLAAIATRAGWGETIASIA